ncbi:DUF3054 domain-containing protein [Rothia sp. ZJ1223]|uniref:DUF3054 domain-containing protein n=1 Tax=Rothia sp. ZJ1223 TaxID=2811098 RepID=UPI00195DA9E4|nr:DUF3054 domain-containing protein [Rothia sp. ZJ1223]MBM7050548.1 DUF3054 domain-containing protein [Rothia sp. ZJ1223]
MNLSTPHKLIVLGMDLLAILIFAVIGRASHGLNLLGIFETALPFMVAALAGFFLFHRWLPAWLAQWLIVANLGMALRILLGGGFAASFWAVALIFTGIILGTSRFITYKLLSIEHS